MPPEVHISPVTHTPGALGHSRLLFGDILLQGGRDSCLSPACSGPRGGSCLARYRDLAQKARSALHAVYSYSAKEQITQGTSSPKIVLPIGPPYLQYDCLLKAKSSFRTSSSGAWYPPSKPSSVQEPPHLGAGRHMQGRQWVFWAEHPAPYQEHLACPPRSTALIGMPNIRDTQIAGSAM